MLSSKVNPDSEAFRNNAKAMQELVDDLRTKVGKISEGGSQRAREKHLSRGKLLPRERVERLLDPGTPFLELSQMAAYGVYEEDVPSAGLITGIGRVSGREVMIICNDATCPAFTSSIAAGRTYRAKLMSSLIEIILAAPFTIKPI